VLVTAPHPPEREHHLPSFERPNAPEHHPSSTTIEMVIPPELIEMAAARAVELLQIRPASEPWLDVAGAAKHLACAHLRADRVQACAHPASQGWLAASVPMQRAGRLA